MKTSDRVIVKDVFDSYSNEHGTIDSFDKNIFGKKLVIVKLDIRPTACFYPEEVTLVHVGEE